MPKSTISEIKNTHCIKYIKSTWCNLDNAAMYKKIPIAYLKQTAVQGGLDNGCDVKAITKYLKHANSILEIGAGYGRALHYIIKNGFKGKLFAIERTPKLCAFLKKQFPQIQIFCMDIQKFKTNRKFNIILLLWTGLCDFSKDEQLPLLQTIVSYLHIDGFLIFDLIPNDCKIINAVNHDKHNKTTQTPYGDNYGYFPSFDEIESYIQQLNLVKKEIITYTTKTNKKRKLYVLQKI